MLTRFLNIAKTITPAKAWNFVRLYSSFVYSRLSGRVSVWGFPVSISVEPGTACNLRCPQCPSGLRQFTRETGMMDPDFFAELLPQINRHLISMNLYFQGEPYLNKNFLRMVRAATEHNIYTITSTNGHFLDESTCRETVQSGLGELIISVDGVSQESYEAYRVGGKLDKVIAGTRHIVAEKRKKRSAKPHVVWQFVVFRHNEGEVPAIKKMAREAGVDELRIKTAQVYDHSSGNALIPETAEYSRYGANGDGSYTLKNPLYNHCWRMWRSCVITWKGEVVPCCFDKDASYRLGVLPQINFRGIWRSAAYDNFRKNVLTNRKAIDICTNCSEGTRIWA